MEQSKILILLFYYNRPEMVKNALNSIKELAHHYKNYEVVAIDDGSDMPLKSIVEDILPSAHYNIGVIRIEDTLEIKQNRGGSIFGQYANEAIKESNAEIAIMLCDDDALIPDYLTNLNKYFRDNPQVNYAYSYVKYYDPEKQFYKEANEIPAYWHPGSTYTLNMHFTPIDPFCMLDSSQVAWRTKCNKEDNIWFPYPQTRGLDAALYKQLYDKYGPCHPTLFFGQYKGAFFDQLGNRKDEFKTTIK